MNEQARWNPAKPLTITAICVIGLINAIQMLNLVFSPVSRHIGAIYPLYFSGAIILSLVCIAGLWMLKRWAAFLYAALLVCNQLVLAAMGYWELSAAVIPVIIVLLLVKHWDKMR
ncbi:hypothetical protein [Methylomarinum vadi]|uniref:hypothetical protein n=1 Tax=Methylomarinum vadi TaxID=438855 RepID=UPI0004DF1A6E|nr:hypothetical protein [Methylomarinum vadi]